MKKKDIRIYLVFWFNQEVKEKYKKLSTYGCTKSGDEFLKFACVQQEDNKCLMFDNLLCAFLDKCNEESELIQELVDTVDGFFNIEIVPRFTSASVPAFVFDRKLFEFVYSLKNKFKHLEIDMYVI